ncbi:rNA polymerase sigma-24 subunit ECF subfamily [Bifidobacterium margollesii]|uniref:RNA polymerase sigma-24 subunit ECF subfamily n=1 Tax=Bifidobacterium margollesii TaxID=2020964 RepID=A0A2N5J7Z0_9BIFI|nr:sigma-70 family RNA polymerase sigma factor [Bifidobacterium margollesii]PLS30323.1 rNA polymerase sigma-24 subunit ECF subfamily [Bifidobacterium margollesii]
MRDGPLSARGTRTLIDAVVRRRSRRAADRLVRAYYDALLRFVSRQLRDADEAHAIVQESFITALRSLSSYDPDKGAFATWLYRIAACRVIDWRRSRPAPPLSVEDASASSEPRSSQNVPSQAADADLLERIESTIADEDERTQVIWRLRIYERMSFPEISSAMDMPEPAVKARHYRLLNRIRKEFGDEYE